MFQWSKKVVKSVTFNPEIADESLLAQVESYLEVQPNKTFSDLCKEALWKFLCVPESAQLASKKANGTTVEQQIGGFEKRFSARESHRLEAIEGQMLQLTQQVAKLAIILNQQALNYVPPMVDSVGVVQSVPEPEPQEVDPVINRIGQFLDDF